jgi:hypothetical protein
VLIWNGSHWQVIPGPPTTGSLWRVWAASQTSVWVIEESATMIWHYNGANSWTPIDPRGSTGSGSPTWRGIWGTGPDDIWIVGADTNTRFSHLSGGNWTMYGATVGGLQDVYVVPGATSAYATDSSGNVYTLTLGGSPNATLIGGSARGSVVSGTSATDVVVWGGTNAPGGKIGASWTKLINSDELPSISDLAATHSGTTVQQIAVGGLGNSMVCDGTTCTGWATGTSAIMTGVSAYAPDRAFIVGTNGTILY